jgi:hypothetical protein
MSLQDSVAGVRFPMPNLNRQPMNRTSATLLSFVMPSGLCLGFVNTCFHAPGQCQVHSGNHRLVQTACACQGLPWVPAEFRRHFLPNVFSKFRSLGWLTWLTGRTKRGLFIHLFSSLCCRLSQTSPESCHGCSVHSDTRADALAGQ